MKLTDDDIAQAAHDFTQDHIDDLRGIDYAWFETMNKAGMRKILALDAQKREDADYSPPPAYLDRAATARPPNRVGQWFKSAYSGDIYGPIVASRDGKHLLQWHIEEGGGYGFYEGLVANRTVVRIPPKLAGMNADECREPVKGEQWYDLGGKLSGPMADESDIATDDVMGRSRWIKAPPARMGYGRDNQIRSCLARDWSMIQIG